MVLLYHRVTRLASDPQLLAVTPERFEQHLAAIAKYACPMSLADVVAAAREDRLPERAVAITFDDGYADNLHEAAPLLERYQIPATVFCATGHIDSDREFFWDELDRLALQPGELPAVLEMDLGTGIERISLAGCTAYTHDQWLAAREWNVLQPAESGSRQALYLQLCGAVHSAKSSRRAEMIAQLQQWSGRGASGRPSHRLMSAAELRALDANPVVDVGAHTVSHPRLSIESAAEQHREIHAGKQTLETILGRPVDSFSYPFGTRRDYTHETAAMVEQAGFASACSNFAGPVVSATDPFQLPRVLVRDWDRVEFTHRLKGWLSSAAERGSGAARDVELSR